MAEKTVTIPARLKSGVVGGHVTGAKDIIDDVKNKTQDTINAEVSDDLSSIHSDIVTIDSKIPTAASASNKLVDNASLIAEQNRAQAAEQANANAIVAEESRAKAAEQANAQNISNEVSRATGAETILQSNIDVEVERATAAETQNTEDINTINSKIPSAATSENQLADKAFVNSSVSTATAEFKGTYDSLEELQAVSADNNDYGFVRTTDSVGNVVYNRYKYNGTQWVFEYALNNSSFTQAQWDAINSLLTISHKTKLDALPTNLELTQLFAGKQDVISDLSTIREGASKGATAYQLPTGGIPKTDLSNDVQESLGKADTAIQDISGKQDVISDLSDIRSGAALGATAYQLPSNGIPSTDLEASIVTSLDKADTAYQKPSDGIPESDLDSLTQTKVDAGSTAYQKPQNGIPEADLESGVQSKLAKADNSVQTETLDNYYTKEEADVLLDNKVDKGDFYTKEEIDTALAGKQETLVSGINIKSVNGNSILGSGDLSISTTGVAYDNDPEMDGTASAGTVSEYARGDHRHPSDSTKQDALTFSTIEDGIAAANELT